MSHDSPKEMHANHILVLFHRNWVKVRSPVIHVVVGIKWPLKQVYFLPESRLRTCLLCRFLWVLKVSSNTRTCMMAGIYAIFYSNLISEIYIIYHHLCSETVNVNMVKTLVFPKIKIFRVAVLDPHLLQKRGFFFPYL